jgi:hypothetical protein
VVARHKDGYCLMRGADVNEKTGDGKPFDPFEAWRGLRDANMDAWSKMMIEGVNTEAYAKASGVMLDSYLTASGPFREMLEQTMTRVLGQLSMPTRDDFVSLAQRLTNIEVRLDDLDAKLDRMAMGARDDAPPRSREKKEAK